jgi:hypothetical protein
MHTTHLFAGLAVSEFVVACDWYERLFDSAPSFYPREGEAVWQVTASASVYVTADAPRSGGRLLALAVKNLDEERAALARRGLHAEEGTEPNGMPTMTLADPDGNTIKMFEDPAGS